MDKKNTVPFVIYTVFFEKIQLILCKLHSGPPRRFDSTKMRFDSAGDTDVRYCTEQYRTYVLDG